MIQNIAIENIGDNKPYPLNQVWVISFRIYRNIQKPHESHVKI